MRKSPYNISYDDLIQAAEKRLEWMVASYPMKVATGTLNSWTATHNLECQKRTVKLLRKFKREPQIDLFEAFEKIK